MKKMKNFFDLDLLSRPQKMNCETYFKPKKLNLEIPPRKIDDNEEIMTLLKGRLSLGRERYGHGVIVNEDTTKYGTAQNDWELMALEEMLDGLIYTTAAIIRLRRDRTREELGYNSSRVNDDMVIDEVRRGYSRRLV